MTESDSTARDTLSSSRGKVPPLARPEPRQGTCRGSGTCPVEGPHDDQVDGVGPPHPPRGQETPTPLPHDDPPPPAEEYPPPLDPDCLAGKHTACLGRAWDEELDAEVECACGCHVVTNVVESL